MSFAAGRSKASVVLADQQGDRLRLFLRICAGHDAHACQPAFLGGQVEGVGRHRGSGRAGLQVLRPALSGDGVARRSQPGSCGIVDETIDTLPTS